MIDRLGDLLIRTGALKESQLSTALETQKKVGGKLGVILVKLQFIQEEELVEALASQLELPSLKMHELIVSPSVSALLDVEILEKNMILPIRRDGESLLLAMADPLDCGVQEEVRFLTGLRTELAVAAYADIQKAIDYYCHGKPCPELEAIERSFRAPLIGASSPPLSSAVGTPANSVGSGGLEARIRALEELLIEKRLLDRGELEARVSKIK